MVIVKLAKTTYKEVELSFKKARVCEVFGKNLTAKLLNEKGETIPLTISMPLLPGIDPKSILGNEIEILTETGRCYGARLLTGKVVSNSIREFNRPPYICFDLEKVENCLYGTE